MIAYDTRVPPRTIEIHASGRVDIGPALLVSAVISGAGADSKAILYDGKDSNGDLKLTLQAATKESFQALFPMGIEFQKGIYLTVSAATDSLTLSFFPGKFVDIPKAKEQDN